MKYIRTKDGKIVKNQHPNAEVFTFRYEILKIADTIEELCDEFIACVSTNKYPIIITDRTIKVIELYKEENVDYEIYGAIWTEWGLIYVAKMNEKGELELI